MKAFGAKILSALFLATAVLALLATIAGYIGSYRNLEILSDYRPFLLTWGWLGLIGAIAVWKLKLGKSVLAAGLGCYLVVSAINGRAVAPWLLARTDAPAPVDAKHIAIKALAFNVEGGNTWFAETREFVRKEAPDIAMFCESVERWSAQLSELTNEFPHHVRVAEMDIEVFSRHPILETNIFHFGEYRGFVVIRISVEGTELTYVATHTYPRQWKGDAGFQLRTAALEKGLGKDLQTFPRPLVVMGDLNASPWSLAFKNMMSTSGFHDARKGRGLLPTQHGHGSITKWLWRPIDHCLYTPDVRMRSFRVGPDLNSDHLPIIAELEIDRK